MGGPPKLAFFVAARGRAEKHRPVRRQAYSMAGALPAGCCVVALADPGKPLKALAATSQERSDIFPDVPTFVEQGFVDTVGNQWAGTLAPALTPPVVTAKLNAAFNAALNDPEVRGKLRQAGVTPSPSSPEEFARYLRDEIARWGKLIREKGIKGE